MRAIVTFALMLALAGCSPPGNPKAKADNATDADTASTTPAAYQEFPAEVRVPIYQWDLANQKCLGRFRPRDEKACAEREALAKDLLAKG